MKTLSIGGRYTIVSNILGILGTFLFSLFKAPKKVLKTLEGIRHDFFGVGRIQREKFHGSNGILPWLIKKLED